MRFVTKMKNRKIEAPAKMRFVTNLFCHKCVLSQKSSLNLRIGATRAKEQRFFTTLTLTILYNTTDQSGSKLGVAPMKMRIPELGKCRDSEIFEVV